MSALYREIAEHNPMYANLNSRIHNDELDGTVKDVWEKVGSHTDEQNSYEQRDREHPAEPCVLGVDLHVLLSI